MNCYIDLLKETEIIICLETILIPRGISSPQRWSAVVFFFFLSTTFIDIIILNILLFFDHLMLTNIEAMTSRDLLISLNFALDRGRHGL